MGAGVREGERGMGSRTEDYKEKSKTREKTDTVERTIRWRKK